MSLYGTRPTGPSGVGPALLDRARAVRPDLEVGDDDVASVVRLCRTLDGASTCD